MLCSLLSCQCSTATHSVRVLEDLKFAKQEGAALWCSGESGVEHRLIPVQIFAHLLPRPNQPLPARAVIIILLLQAQESMICCPLYTAIAIACDDSGCPSVANIGVLLTLYPLHAAMVLLAAKAASPAVAKRGHCHSDAPPLLSACSARRRSIAEVVRALAPYPAGPHEH